MKLEILDGGLPNGPHDWREYPGKGEVTEKKTTTFSCPTKHQSLLIIRYMQLLILALDAY